MISFKELLSGTLISDLPFAHEHNLEDLLHRINVVREAWGRLMIVTSGYRSLQHHKDIYRAKGITDDKIPLGSKHLIGCAVDIADPEGALYNWLRNTQEGINCMSKADLYGELETKGWVHLQSQPPKSKNRWFYP